MKKRRIVGILLVLLVIGSITTGWYILRRGFSARSRPNAIEAYVAPRLRNLAIPRAARAAMNPIADSPETLGEAMEHFADHCAFCHASDGSGKTPVGEGLYPNPPDMRQPPTQRLTDGELYYIIENGVRFTGMPAFGELSDGANSEDSWKLVTFIRHVPNLTPEQVQQIDEMTPKSPLDLKREQEIEDFLKGGDVPASHENHQHSHKQ